MNRAAISLAARLETTLNQTTQALTMNTTDTTAAGALIGVAFHLITTAILSHADRF